MDQRYFSDRYTITEQILRSKKDMCDALNEIIVVVEEKVFPDFRMRLDELPTLDPVIYCFLTVGEWLNYEEWEGFEGALYFHPERVVDQIEKTLHLPEIALILKRAKQIHREQFEQQQVKLTREGFVSPTPEFTAWYHLFEVNKPKVVEALYSMVKMNVTKFP